MTSKTLFRAGTAAGSHTLMRSLALIATILLTLHPTKGLALQQLSFSWQANPPAEFVLGYRLYYGTSSRFANDGSLKAHFSYDHYIDLFQEERCPPDGSACEPLAATELQCEGTQTDTPRCTLFNLEDQRLFLTLTAYNADTESGYTPELSTPFSPGVLNGVQVVNLMLLAKKRR